MAAIPSTRAPDFVAAMTASRRQNENADTDALAAAITACLACAQACTACSAACLRERELDRLRTCIALDLDCADLCATTAWVLSRNGAHDARLAAGLLEACQQACESCAAECARHADMHEHCRICAEACRACAGACRSVLAALPIAS